MVRRRNQTRQDREVVNEMNTELTNLDRKVQAAFDRFAGEISCSKLLGKIAKNPDGRQETVIANFFRDALDKEFQAKLKVWLEYPHHRYTYDIAILWPKQKQELIAVVEVKTPFTDSGGISSKTNGTRKDMKALKVALDTEVIAAYELVTPIGAYPVRSNGDIIDMSKKAVQHKYGIQWPMSDTYPVSGKRDVDKAMKSLSAERDLSVTQIRGWKHIDLPRPQARVHSFIDCALYKLENSS